MTTGFNTTWNPKDLVINTKIGNNNSFYCTHAVTSKTTTNTTVSLKQYAFIIFVHSIQMLSTFIYESHNLNTIYHMFSVSDCVRLHHLWGKMCIQTFTVLILTLYMSHSNLLFCFKCTNTFQWAATMLPMPFHPNQISFSHLFHFTLTAKYAFCTLKFTWISVFFS